MNIWSHLHLGAGFHHKGIGILAAFEKTGAALAVIVGKIDLPANQTGREGAVADGRHGFNVLLSVRFHQIC